MIKNFIKKIKFDDLDEEIRYNISRFDDDKHDDGVICGEALGTWIK